MELKRSGRGIQILFKQPKLAGDSYGYVKQTQYAQLINTDNTLFNNSIFDNCDVDLIFNTRQSQSIQDNQHTVKTNYQNNNNINDDDKNNINISIETEFKSKLNTNQIQNDFNHNKFKSNAILNEANLNEIEVM